MEGDWKMIVERLCEFRSVGSLILSRTQTDGYALDPFDLFLERHVQALLSIGACQDHCDQRADLEMIPSLPS